jgi:hypothetical protein
VPTHACTLPAAEHPFRVAEFDALFAAALLSQERLAPGWLRLYLRPDEQVATTARELTERESRCCSFFAFEVRATDGELRLDVRVPDGRAHVLDGIVRQTEIRGRTGRTS